MSYRKHITEQILELVAARHGELGDLAAVLELGLQHEQQHQELIITDIKHLLSANPRLPAYHDVPLPPTSDAPKLGWLSLQGGLRAVGHSGDGFAFDNELPQHRTFLEPYQLATRLVTNGEYLEFVREGGYSRPELWLSDGLRIVAEQNWSAPLYWHGGVDDTHVFTLAGLQSLLPQEPVCHVSYYEADAFSRWAGARLPSEFEWENAAAEVLVTGNLLSLRRMHPAVAVAGGTPLLQVFGDVWEWTASAYLPYPGYRPAAGALGEYNGKFMCNQMVLRGGSCATPVDHIRASYRNFFPADARWQFTGIRLARSA
jgi:ergothioneine biosynthesis protein EgtB